VRIPMFFEMEAKSLESPIRYLCTLANIPVV